MKVITARTVTNFTLALSSLLILGYVCLGLVGYIADVDYKMAWMFMVVNTMVWLSME